MDRNKIPYDTHHQGVLSDVSKLISEHMVRSMHTVHLSCTISKRTKLSFPREPLHLGVASGASKIVLSIWFIRHKPCTYVTPKLRLFLIIPKWDSIWHMLGILNVTTKSRLSFLMPNLSLMPLKPSCHPQHDMRDAVLKYAIALLNKKINEICKRTD